MFQFGIIPLIIIVLTASYLYFSTSTSNLEPRFENQPEQVLKTNKTSETNDLVLDFNPSKGPKDARIVVVHFFDFECPGCAMAHPVDQKISEKYNSKVRFVYKMFPLKAIHPNAESAARSALAAHIQGKYFEYASELFKNQLENKYNYQSKKSIDNDQQSQAAKNVGLDIEKWNNDRESSMVKTQLEADINQGKTAQIPILNNSSDLKPIDSTPTFVFIKDGVAKYKTNYLSVDEFSQQLDDLLQN